jgi:hypothetical protein
LNTIRICLKNDTTTMVNDLTCAQQQHSELRTCETVGTQKVEVVRVPQQTIGTDVPSAVCILEDEKGDDKDDK